MEKETVQELRFIGENSKVLNEARLERLRLQQKQKTLNERAELVKFFLEKINNGRIGTKYRLLTAKDMAVKLGHLKELKDLYFLKSYCQQSNDFSKAFWSSLKVR